MDHPSSPSAPRIAPEVSVGGYHVLGRLAVGGMSELFLAHESADGEVLRYVVIKLLPAAAAHAALGSSHADAEEMFLREGRTLLRLDHPNICHSYAFGTTGARCYIAMEWIDGVSLRELLIALREQARSLSFSLAANLVAQVAAGLEHAHGARDARLQPLRVVHRDVNPTNIMVRYDGVVKLIDFGVAQVAERRVDAAHAAVRGKIAYMAPEQIRGESLDHRADIFALGVCLYELLTGSRLYRRSSAQATAGAVLDEDVPSPRDVHPDVPEELDAIVRRALQKDPAARFESAAELQAALEDYLVRVGKPMGARPLAALMRDAFHGRGGKPEIEQLADLAERFSDPGPLPVATTPRNDTMRPEGYARLQHDDGHDAVHFVGADERKLGSEHSGLVATERAASAARTALLESAPSPAERMAPAQARRRALWPLSLGALALAAAGSALYFRQAPASPPSLAEAPPVREVAAPAVAAPAAAAPEPAPESEPESEPISSPARDVESEPASAGSAADAGIVDVPTPERKPRAFRQRSSPGFIADPGF